MSGRWVQVNLAAGAVRQDWVPEEQPASPDGGPGWWHVVNDPSGAARWEWFPRVAPPMPPGPPGGPLGPPPAAWSSQPFPIGPQPSNPHAGRKTWPWVAGGVAAVVLIGALASAGAKDGDSAGRVAAGSFSSDAVAAPDATDGFCQSVRAKVRESDIASLFGELSAAVKDVTEYGRNVGLVFAVTARLSQRANELAGQIEGIDRKSGLDLNVSDRAVTLQASLRVLGTTQVQYVSQVDEGTAAMNLVKVATLAMTEACFGNTTS